MRSTRWRSCRTRSGAAWSTHRGRCSSPTPAGRRPCASWSGRRRPSRSSAPCAPSARRRAPRCPGCAGGPCRSSAPASTSDPKEGSVMSDETYHLKTALAEMLKGGVILDVTSGEQARIAEDAGAAAVMALERVPADIRSEGGVARMAAVERIEEVRAAVSIPVMAKCRIGHVVEARLLQQLGVDFVDESEVLTPADDEYHIDKHAFRVPFVCGARGLGEALRRIGEGAAMIRSKGEAGSGNIVEAVRHLRQIRRELQALVTSPSDEHMAHAKALGAPY